MVVVCYIFSIIKIKLWSICAFSTCKEINATKLVSPVYQ